MIIPLKCQSPQRIRNPYTHEWMFVPCRKCPACIINKSNAKAVHLSEDVKSYPFVGMLTLTYDNRCVPCVRKGDNRIFRGVDFPTSILCTHDLEWSDDAVLLNAPDNNQFVGVLYYKDYQNYIKRLRITYERKNSFKFPWRIFGKGEYGSLGKRPHFHILFYGFREFTENDQNLMFECWPFSDWSRLRPAKAFVIGCQNIGSYLTTYINSGFNSDGFYAQKGIAEKTFRSKNLGFGVDNEVETRFQKSFGCGFSELLQSAKRNPFEVFQQAKLGLLSVDCLPKKFISAYFSVPTGLCSASFDYFSRCVANALGGRIQSANGNSEYLTNLSYRRYCNARNIPQNLSSRLDFIYDAWNYRNMYKSIVIKQSMLEYEVFTNKKDYFRSRFNTCVDDMEKRRSRFWFRYHIMVNDGLEDDALMALDNYVSDYDYKLLPKHLKSLQNGW